MEFIFGDEKRFFDFMGNISDKDRVGIVSHTDCDGISSALIASKIIGKIDYLQFVHPKPGAIDKVIKELKKGKINKVIFTDIFIKDKEILKEIERFAEVLIIDHHPSENDLNSNKIIYLKAESEYPSSYMCYYLFSKIQKIPGWIAAFGIVADRPDKYNEKNADEVYKDFKLEKSEGDLWRSFEDISFALATFRNGEEQIYNILSNFKSLEEIDFGRYIVGIKEEFNKKLEEFEKNKEVHDSVVFYYLDSKYSIKTLLINKISSKYPCKTIIFISNRNVPSGSLDISFRRQDKRVDCNLLMKEVVKDIPNSTGGGHRAAAGAIVPVKYLEKFKENIINRLGK